MSLPTQCPHCGAEPRDIYPDSTQYHCFTWVGATLDRTDLCRERAKSQKLEAEVERLRANLRRAIEIAEVLDYHHAPYTDKYYNLWDQLDALKATLNPTDK